MTNFWNKISDSEIYIYGDIVAEKFFDAEVTAKQFADDLKSCGKNVTLRINSNGGDCFTALAISNLIKQSDKNITVSIDGICASAATLIACAGKKITMAENALMMIHLPSVFLYDFYDAIQLAKIESSLNKVRDSILATYAARTGLEITDLTAMLEAETWLSAAEAKELNFVDEVTGEVETLFDDARKLLIINSLQVKKNYYAKAKEKLKMDNQSLLDKIKNLLAGGKDVSRTREEKTAERMENVLSGIGNGVSGAGQSVENSQTKTARENDGQGVFSGSEPENQARKVEEVRAAELARIKALNSERCGLGAVNAVIDVALAEGKSLADVQKYIDAIKNLPPAENKVADKILALIEDNLKSGAEGVGGSEEKIPADDSKAQADLIAKFANANLR